MRIIAGQHRGQTLEALGAGDEKARLRPTSDRVREAIFSALTGGRMGNPIDGARVLDLFAGTGALGLEALSRGASNACFVENGDVAQRILNANINRLDRGDDCTVTAFDAVRLPLAPHPFDLVFLDPPYGQRLGALALAAAKDGGWLAPGAIVVWEENAQQIAPRGFRRMDAKRYGDTWVTFLMKLR